MFSAILRRVDQLTAALVAWAVAIVVTSCAAADPLLEASNTRARSDHRCPAPSPDTGSSQSLAVALSAACAIDRDGAVLCWGADLDRPTRVPWVDDAVALDGLGARFCAYTRAGVLSCWSLAPGGTFEEAGAWDVGCDLRHAMSCTLDSAGAVTCHDEHEAPTQHRFTGLDVAEGMLCGMADGRPTCSGDADSPLSDSQLGESGWRDVSVGAVHWAREREPGFHGGRVWFPLAMACFWGDTEMACDVGGMRLPLRPVDAERIREVAVGLYGPCVLYESGALYCLDRAELAQTPLQLPPQPFLTEVVDVDLGEDLGCARSVDGDIACWGSDAHRAVTLGQPMKHGAPRHRREGDFIDLTMSETHACALSADGRAACWGALAVGRHVDVRDAVTIEVSEVAAVAVDDQGFTYLRDASGQEWQAEAIESLTTDLTSGSLAARQAVRPMTDDDWNRLAAPRNASCEVSAAGELHCAGSALEDASQVYRGRTVERVASNGRTACVILTEGAIECWGEWFVPSLRRFDGDGVDAFISTPVEVRVAD